MTILVRLLCIGALVTALCGAALGQSTPDIRWMRGAVTANAGRGLKQIALSPNNQTLATCGGDGTAKIRRVSDGILLHTLVDFPQDYSSDEIRSSIECIAYSPDGSRIATGSSRAVRLWDVASGTLLHSWDTPLPFGASIDSVAISPNGANLIAAWDNDIHVWNLADFSLSATLTGHTDEVHSVAFSADNQKIASGSSDGTVRIWRVSDGALLRTLYAPNAGVLSVAFSPDNSTVCAGANTLQIWNATTGVLLHNIQTNYTPRTLTISADGQRVVAEDGPGFSDATLKLFRISDGALLSSANANVVSTAYSSDGAKVYTVTRDSRIDLWSGTNLSALGTQPSEHFGSVRAVAFNPSGTLVATASEDCFVKIWDAATGALLRTLPTSTDFYWKDALAFSPDGSILAVSDAAQSGATTTLYRVSDGTLLRTINSGAAGLTFTLDGAYLALASGNDIDLYRLSDGSLFYVLSGHTAAVNALALSPDGSTLASASSDNTVRTWSLTTFTPLHTYPRHSAPVRSIAFSPDGQNMVSGSDDKTCILWQLSTGFPIHIFSHDGPIRAAVVSKDGKQVLAGGDDRHLKIWDIALERILYDYTSETGVALWPLTPYPEGVTSAVYSPDGKSIVYGRDDATFVVAVNPLYEQSVTSVTFTDSSVFGGSSVLGTVTINRPAATGVTVVSLSSSNPALAATPSTVTIPAGLRSANFTVNTTPVSTTTAVAITGSLNGTSQSANLMVYAPGLVRITVSPATILGGKDTTGFVFLSDPAPPGGTKVTLSSSSANATLPASVTVPGGAVFTTFVVGSQAVARQTVVTLTATSGSSSPQALLTLTPPTLTALSVSPSSVKGGVPSTGTVTLSDPAPAGGILVTLSSSNFAIASPASFVTIASGATTATFAITTYGVSATSSVTVTGKLNGNSSSAALTVTPPTITSFTIDPASVQSGQSILGTVVLSDPAPTGGIQITLSNANSTAVQAPATIQVPGGLRFASVLLETQAVTVDTPVVLTTTLEASSAAATLTVQAPILIAMSVSPTVIRVHEGAVVTVTLKGAAPPGGVVVNLFSSDTSVATLPATVTVAAGANTATATVTTSIVHADSRILFAATLGTSNVSVHFTVQPHLPFDVNNDVHNDIILQNTLTNLVTIWYMNALTVTGTDAVRSLPTKGYTVVGGADFNSDLCPDLVFQNQTTGQVVFWYLIGTFVVGGEALSQSPNASYKVVGTGDFNGDGSVDLVFQNPGGSIVIWYLQGAKVIGGVSLPFQPAVGYNVVGVGDFNKDGKPDLLFQNVNTGQVVVWYMNGANFLGGGGISYLPPLVWKVKGVADYNNDGTPDIVFQNSSTNQVLIWFMNGLTVTGGDLISIQPAAPNAVVGPR